MYLAICILAMQLVQDGPEIVVTFCRFLGNFLLQCMGGSRTSPGRGRQSLGGGAPTQYFSNIF